METKIINGLEFKHERVPMDGHHYNRDGLRFQIRYYDHNYFSECYTLNYKDNFPYAKNLEEVEIKVVKSLYFKISEKYKRYNELNDAIKDIDRKCFR